MMNGDFPLYTKKVITAIRPCANSTTKSGQDLPATEGDPILPYANAPAAGVFLSAGRGRYTGRTSGQAPYSKFPPAEGVSYRETGDTERFDGWYRKVG